MHLFSNHFKKSFATFGIIVMIIPIAVTFVPQKAEAGAGAAACGLGAAIGAIIAVMGVTADIYAVPAESAPGTTGHVSTANSEWTNKIITCVVKPLLKQMILQFIRQMGASVVDWINGGFEGKPLFVTDFEGLLENTADAAVGEFIEGSALGFLCKQGSLDLKVRLALALNYAKPLQTDVSCTLSSIKSNVNGAINGWDDWLVLSTQPQNNFQGAYLIAQNNLTKKLASVVGVKKDEVQRNKGFLDFKTCTKTESAADAQKRVDQAKVNSEEYNQIVTASQLDPKPGCSEYKTSTPGGVIADKLSSTLGQGDIAAAVADDIDAIINATLMQLGKKLISGTKGLLGLSKSSSYSYGTPYRDSIQSKYYGVSAQTTVTTQGSGTSVMDQYGTGVYSPDELTNTNNINSSINTATAPEVTKAATDLTAAVAATSTSVISTGSNLATGKPVSQSGTSFVNTTAGNATDKVRGLSAFPPAVTAQMPDPWWQVDLGSSMKITSVSIWKPMDKLASEAIGTIQVIIKDAVGTVIWVSSPITMVDGSGDFIPIATLNGGQPVMGQVVEIQRINNYDSACTSTGGFYRALMLDEVEVN